MDYLEHSYVQVLDQEELLKIAELPSWLSRKEIGAKERG
jgi:hypothetical protein